MLNSRRRILFWILGSVAVVVAAMVVLRLTGSRDDSGPLTLGDNFSSVGVGVNVGELLTYGDIIIKNQGGETIVIEKAELQTTDSDAFVAEVRLLDTDAASPGSLAGEAYGFNPPSAAMTIPGATMEPSQDAHRKFYQFLFAIKVTGSSKSLFNSVQVEYRVGNHKYVKSAPYQLQICTPKGANCPVAPPKDQ